MMPDTERQQLTDAVVAVAERSLYAYAEAVPVDSVGRMIEGGWYDAAVSFEGPFCGRVGVSVPVVLAHQFCAAFLGESDVDDESAVRDMVGEFANMACGTWLTGLDRSGCFDLTHPEVTKVDEAPEPHIALMINDLPVTLTATVAES